MLQVSSQATGHDLDKCRVNSYVGSQPRDYSLATSRHCGTLASIDLNHGHVQAIRGDQSMNRHMIIAILNVLDFISCFLLERYQRHTERGTR